MILKEKSSLIDAISIALITAICILLVFYLSPKNERCFFTIVILCINCVVGLIAKKLWIEESIQNYTIFDWVKATGLSIIIVVALYICDVAIGLIGYPDLVFYEAAQTNIGFIITIFVSPIILIALTSTLRACLLYFFKNKK